MSRRSHGGFGSAFFKHAICVVFRLAFILLQRLEAVDRLVSAFLPSTFEVSYAISNYSHLIIEHALLTFGMFERAEWFGTRIVPATDVKVRKLAAWDVAIRTVLARSFDRMSELAVDVGAARDEYAVGSVCTVSGLATMCRLMLTECKSRTTRCGTIE
jgi:hypothetical protein